MLNRNNKLIVKIKVQQSDAVVERAGGGLAGMAASITLVWAWVGDISCAALLAFFPWRLVGSCFCHCVDVTFFFFKVWKYRFILSVSMPWAPTKLDPQSLQHSMFEDNKDIHR